MVGKPVTTALALMLAQVATWGEAEPQAERAERLAVIEAAAALESDTPPDGWRWSGLALKATLLATTYEEGAHWSRSVHDGSRLGDGSRARCLAQLHRHPSWVPGPMWRATTGTDLEATRLCMRGAARVLAHYSAACVTPWKAEREFEASIARVVAGYGTGRSCNPYHRPWALARVRRVTAWLRELEAA